DRTRGTPLFRLRSVCTRVRTGISSSSAHLHGSSDPPLRRRFFDSCGHSAMSRLLRGRYRGLTSFEPPLEHPDGPQRIAVVAAAGSMLEKALLQFAHVHMAC